MTAPEPGAQDLRARIASALHIGLDDACPNDPAEGEAGHQRWVERVQEWAAWIHEQYQPYLVELPEPDEGGQIPTWRDGSGNRWTAWNEGVEDEFDCLVEDLDRLRRTAAVILAACAASERMAAEQPGGESR